MQDIKIDFTNNKLVNEYVSGKDRVIQQITVACRSWIGDFFLNDEFGIDYDNNWGNMDLTKLFIREQVLAINGVSSINKIDIKKTRDINQKTIYVVDIEIVYNKEIFSIPEILIYQ